MKCPRCGSEYINTQVLTETTSSEKIKGFGCIKSCIGFLLFNLPGLLCGLCGMGKGKISTSTKERIIHICQGCGNRW